MRSLISRTREGGGIFLWPVPFGTRKTLKYVMLADPHLLFESIHIGVLSC